MLNTPPACAMSAVRRSTFWPTPSTWATQAPGPNSTPKKRALPATAHPESIGQTSAIRASKPTSDNAQRGTKTHFAKWRLARDTSAHAENSARTLANPHSALKDAPEKRVHREREQSAAHGAPLLNSARKRDAPDDFAGKRQKAFAVHVQLLDVAQDVRRKPHAAQDGYEPSSRQRRNAVRMSKNIDAAMRCHMPE